MPITPLLFFVATGEPAMTVTKSADGATGFPREGNVTRTLKASPLFRVSFPLYAVALAFRCALGQHARGRACSTVVHFSPHSFTLLCLLSVSVRHRDQTGPLRGCFPSPPLPLQISSPSVPGRSRRVPESAMNYLFARIIARARNTLDSAECPQFSTQSRPRPSFFPLALTPFLARRKDED